VVAVGQAYLDIGTWTKAVSDTFSADQISKVQDAHGAISTGVQSYIAGEKAVMDENTGLKTYPSVLKWKSSFFTSAADEYEGFLANLTNKLNITNTTAEEQMIAWKNFVAMANGAYETAERAKQTETTKAISYIMETQQWAQEQTASSLLVSGAGVALKAATVNPWYGEGKPTGNNLKQDTDGGWGFWRQNWGA
jgi:hypothetical protein